jgi:DMSO/TMAO reductase YedYZ heme-binding membrane subunit
MKPWHFRHARGIVYLCAAASAIAVAAVSATDSPHPGSKLVTARQLYGLWALGTLLASMLIGPLTSVLPWLPFKPSLLYSRRAVGITAIGFAALHVAAYVWTLSRRTWRELYTPGPLWVAGLILGTVALADLLALGLTSTDAAVKRMGGRRWKRLHRTTYALLPLLLLHAIAIGADFGVNRAPDVSASPDAGALIGFLCLSLSWGILFVLRRRNVRLTPRVVADRKPA